MFFPSLVRTGSGALTEAQFNTTDQELQDAGQELFPAEWAAKAKGAALLDAAEDSTMMAAAQQKPAPFPSVPYYGLLPCVSFSIDVHGGDAAEGEKARRFSAQYRRWAAVIRARCGHHQFGPDVPLHYLQQQQQNDKSSAASSSGATAAGAGGGRGKQQQPITGSRSSRGVVGSTNHHHGGGQGVGGGGHYNSNVSSEVLYSRYIDALCDAFTTFTALSSCAVGNAPYISNGAANAQQQQQQQQQHSDQHSGGSPLSCSLLPPSAACAGPLLYLFCQRHPRLKNFTALFFVEDGRAACFLCCDTPALRRQLTAACADVGVELVWVSGAALVQQSVGGAVLGVESVDPVSVVFDTLLNLSMDVAPPAFVASGTAANDGGGGGPTADGQKDTKATTAAAGGVGEDASSLFSGASCWVGGMTVMATFAFQYGEWRCPTLRMHDPVPIPATNPSSSASTDIANGNNSSTGGGQRYPWTVAAPPGGSLLAGHCLPALLACLVDGVGCNNMTVSFPASSFHSSSFSTSVAAAGSSATAAGKQQQQQPMTSSAGGGGGAGGGPFLFGGSRAGGAGGMREADEHIFYHGLCASRLSSSAWISAAQAASLLQLTKHNNNDGKVGNTPQQQQQLGANDGDEDEELECEFVPLSIEFKRQAQEAPPPQSAAAAAGGSRKRSRSRSNGGAAGEHQHKAKKKGQEDSGQAAAGKMTMSCFVVRTRVLQLLADDDEGADGMGDGEDDVDRHNDAATMA